MRDAPSILTLGDMVLDVFVKGVLGDARDGDGAVRLFPGGSAANFAVGAARAGARVRMLGRVGADVSGRLLVAELAREGVHGGVGGGIQVDDARATGHVLVVREADAGASRMISEPGASLHLDPAAFEDGWFSGLDAFHVTGYSLFRPGPAAAVRAAHAAVKRACPGALTTFDPAPAYLADRAGVREARAVIGGYGFDVLFPNLDEGRVLAGLVDPHAIVRDLRALAPVVVLTMGADGCLVGVGDACEWVAAERVPAVDTTGAGDAFAAGFVVAYAVSRDAMEAARCGTRAAAVVVGHVGARG